jgi:hypothetical protein
MKRVGIYLRISTNNGQTTDNPLRELEAVAKRPVGMSSKSSKIMALEAPRDATSGPPSTGCSRR